MTSVGADLETAKPAIAEQDGFDHGDELAAETLEAEFLALSQGDAYALGRLRGRRRAQALAGLAGLAGLAAMLGVFLAFVAYDLDSTAAREQQDVALIRQLAGGRP